jgi:hypothetical protein
MVDLRIIGITTRTTYVEYGTATIVSTITPRPTPTQQASYYPTHRGNHITNKDKLVQIYSSRVNLGDKCSGTDAHWKLYGGDNEHSEPAGNNYMITG